MIRTLLAKFAKRSMANNFISVSEAAERLGVTPQSVRNWIKFGQIAWRTSGRRFEVDEKDVQSREAAGSIRAPRSSRATLQSAHDIDRRISMLELELESLRLERDRFRADAAAADSSALESSAVAAELAKATRQLVDTLELQIAATSRLLTPNSPADL